MSFSRSIQRQFAALAIAGIASWGIVGCAGSDAPANASSTPETPMKSTESKAPEAGSSTGGGAIVPAESGSSTN